MGSVSVVMTMSNNLNSIQAPPNQKSPEDIIRNLQLQLAQCVADGSGLASASYRHHRDKRKVPHDDSNWNIKVAGPMSGEEESKTVKRRGYQCSERTSELQQYLDVLRQHEAEPCTLDSTSPPLQPDTMDSIRLPYPVIIPQRRIMNRSRGFVYNYSPSLQDAGVSEESFSNFINQLNRIAELKPRAQAIDFSGFANLCSNTHHDFFISMAVSIAVKATREIQHSTVLNRFIEKTNNELFKPKGLICLPMTWKSEGPGNLSPDRGTTGRRLKLAKDERRGRTQRSRERLSLFHGLGIFEWPQSMSLDCIEGDTNTLLETATSTVRNQHSTPNHGAQSIYGETKQRIVTQHMENHPEAQLATAGFEIQIYSKEGISFQLSDNSGFAAPKVNDEVSFSDSNGQLTSEEKDTDDDGLSSSWHPATSILTGDTKEGLINYPNLRTNSENSNARGSTLSPSFTTGALKVLETEILYLLIANIPNDDKAERDKSGISLESFGSIG
ncbi:FAD binding domain protein [Colletotrichum tofieldiae]|uniref:FAD binding domain protein n=1 Tax=Colletotrichum tofieldiae TaxID=708197 RepID=A0A166QDY6_9PEZI|nr:FAD binding domain protein [Colletotrichum tofieldiae]